MQSTSTRCALPPAQGLSPPRSHPSPSCLQHPPKRPQNMEAATRELRALAGNRSPLQSDTPKRNLRRGRRSQENAQARSPRPTLRAEQEAPLSGSRAQALWAGPPGGCTELMGMPPQGLRGSGGPGLRGSSPRLGVTFSLFSPSFRMSQALLLAARVNSKLMTPVPKGLSNVFALWGLAHTQPFT